MTEKFRVSQTIETSSIKKQYNILTEKTETEAKIMLQILRGDKSLLYISVLIVKEKFIISMASNDRYYSVELTPDKQDLTRDSWLNLLHWLSLSENDLAKLVEERGFDFVYKQLTRDLFIFLMENVRVQL